MPFKQGNVAVIAGSEKRSQMRHIASGCDGEHVGETWQEPLRRDLGGITEGSGSSSSATVTPPQRGLEH